MTVRERKVFVVVFFQDTASCRHLKHTRINLQLCATVTISFLSTYEITVDPDQVEASNWTDGLAALPPDPVCDNKPSCIKVKSIQQLWPSSIRSFMRSDWLRDEARRGCWNYHLPTTHTVSVSPEDAALTAYRASLIFNLPAVHSLTDLHNVHAFQEIKTFQESLQTSTPPLMKAKAWGVFSSILSPVHGLNFWIKWWNKIRIPGSTHQCWTCSQTGI